MRRLISRPVAVWLAGFGGLLLSSRPAAPDIAQTTQSLSLQMQAIGKLSVPSSLALTASGPRFGSFQASLPVSYRVRTSPAGNATITIRVSSDFLRAGGPSAAAGGLTYTCGGATLGTACTGSQSASPSAQTPVLSVPASACTGGGAPCSGANPNTVQVNFILDNDPAYPTGSYSAQVLFTISAL